MIMRRYDKKMNHKVFDDEKYIRERTHLVRVPRLKNEVQKAGTRAIPKPKGYNAKKGGIPRM